MPSVVTEVWVYLSANPLLWLTATMVGLYFRSLALSEER